MLYLLYFRDGFIKKFPLEKKTVWIGRDRECDLCLDEAVISKKHARLTVLSDTVEIEDFRSTNGVFIDDERIDRAQIVLNHYFRLGHTTFFLKSGNARELILSDKVQPVWHRLSRAIGAEGHKTDAAINVLFASPLLEMLQIGFRLENFRDLFSHAEAVLGKTLKKGCLMLLFREPDNTARVITQWGYREQYGQYWSEVLRIPGLFQQKYGNREILDDVYVCSYPVTLPEHTAMLLYMVEAKAPPGQLVSSFLEILADEILIIDNLIRDNQLAAPGESENTAPDFITASPVMMNLLLQCRKIARSNLFVLIEGETGTGKELIARYLHSQSPRRQGEFVALNCAAIPESLMEAELFGHEKGAFTDAHTQRKGKLEISSGGTLVLDEVGDMPLNLQAKLLRAVQEGAYYRIGGGTPISVDLRLICLTNRNIKELIARSLFREDFYYRIAHVVLKVPPLRERREDVVPLINHFVERFSRENGIYLRGFAESAMHALESYDWPGNVRELENEIRKIVNLSENGDSVDLSLLKEEIRLSYLQRRQSADRGGADEREALVNLLQKHRFNKTLVARELHISRPSLYEKLRKYGLS